MKSAVSRLSRRQQLAGCLIGCAVADAICLPFEGLSPARAKKWATIPLQHHFLFGRGMVSDDTDHTIFVAQSLILGGGNAEKFRSKLAWRLRLWFLCLPAGIGFATLRSILKLWCGFRRSGVFSAGNGPAMRSAIIGVFFAKEAEVRRAHVEASTLLTHTDPKALAAAAAVAEIAAKVASKEWIKQPSWEQLEEVLRLVSQDRDWLETVKQMREAFPLPIEEVAARFGTAKGVSGYALHSVPFAILVWHRHFGRYRACIETIAPAGGDTDSIAAIAGALAGAASGREGIPKAWVNGVTDWPHGIRFLERLAATMDGENVGSLRFSPLLFVRGLLFTSVVLFHGFRRLLP